VIESSGAHYVNETHLFVYEARGAAAAHTDLTFGDRHPNVVPPRNETGHLLEVGDSAMVGGLQRDAALPRAGAVLLLGEGHERHAVMVNHIVETDGAMHVTCVDTSHAFEWLHLRVRLGVPEDHHDMPPNANLSRAAKRLALSAYLPGDTDDPLALNLDWSNTKFPLTYLTPGVDISCGDCQVRVVPVFELELEMSMAWLKPVVNRARLVVGAQLDVSYTNHIVLSGLSSLVYFGVPFPRTFPLGPPTGWTFPLGPIPINILPELSFGAVSILQVTGYLEMDLGFRMGGEVAVGFEYRRGEGMTFISESSGPAKPSYFEPVAHVEVAPPYKRTMTRVLSAGEIVLTINLWKVISPLVAIRPLQVTAAWHHESDRCPDAGGAFSLSAGTAAYCGLGLFGGKKVGPFSMGSLALAQGLPTGAAGQMHPSQELYQTCLPQDGVTPVSLTPEEYAAARETYFNEHPRGAWEPEPLNVTNSRSFRHRSETVRESLAYPRLPSPLSSTPRLAQVGGEEGGAVWSTVEGGVSVDVLVPSSPGPLDAHVRFCLPAGDVEVPPQLTAALAELDSRLFESDLDAAGIDAAAVDPSYEANVMACRGLRTPFLSGAGVGLVDDDGARLWPTGLGGGDELVGSILLRPSLVSSLLHSAHGQVQVQLIVSAARDPSIAVYSPWLTTTELSSVDEEEAAAAAATLFTPWSACDEASLCDPSKVYFQERRVGCVSTKSSTTVSACPLTPSDALTRPCAVFDCPAEPLTLVGPTTDLGTPSSIFVTPGTFAVDFVGGSATDEFLVDVLIDGCPEREAERDTTGGPSSLFLSQDEWVTLPGVAVVQKAGTNSLGEDATHRLHLNLPAMPAMPLTLRVRPVVPLSTGDVERCVDETRSLHLPPLTVTSYRLFSIALIDAQGNLLRLAPPSPASSSYPLRVSFVGVAKTVSAPLHVPASPTATSSFSTQLLNLDPGVIIAITLDNLQRLLEQVDELSFPLSLSISITDLDALEDDDAVTLPAGFDGDADLQAAKAKSAGSDLPETHLFSLLTWEEVTASRLAPVVLACTPSVHDVASGAPESRCSAVPLDDAEPLFEQLAAGRIETGCNERRLDGIVGLQLDTSPDFPACSASEPFGDFRVAAVDDTSSSISPVVLAVIAASFVCLASVCAFGVCATLLVRRRSTVTKAAAAAVAAPSYQSTRSRRSSTRHVRRHTSSSPDRHVHHSSVSPL
jgi:hypothetical protein